MVAVRQSFPRNRTDFVTHSGDYAKRKGTGFTTFLRNSLTRCNFASTTSTQRCQAVRSYREGGKVKKEVIHLGPYDKPEKALAAWPEEVAELERVGRPRKADKLQTKIQRLKGWT